MFNDNDNLSGDPMEAASLVLHTIPKGVSPKPETLSTAFMLLHRRKPNVKELNYMTTKLAKR